MLKLKLTTIGSSVGLVLPKDAWVRLRVAKVIRSFSQKSETALGLPLFQEIPAWKGFVAKGPALGPRESRPVQLYSFIAVRFEKLEDKGILFPF
jgi:hypothetical protein